MFLHRVNNIVIIDYDEFSWESIRFNGGTIKKLAQILKR